MEKIKAGIFMRVSTKDQNTENQKQTLLDLTKNRGFELTKIYDITASATGKDNLKADYLNEVYEDARLGKINVLLVWALDRLTRRDKGYLLTIFKRFDRYNLQVISYREGFLETLTDLSIRHVFLTFWEYLNAQESVQRAERQKAAIQLMKKQGRRLGRPPGSKDKKTRLKSGYFGNQNKARERSG